MKEYRYKLESGSKKHLCPSCGKRRFVKYVNISTGAYLPEQYGKCDRAVNCGYNLSPYSDGYGANDIKPFEFKPLPIQRERPTSYISIEIFKKSLTAYHENNFVTFLMGLFGKDVTTQLCSRYLIGTSKHWPGSTVFWQMDTQGKVRTGKIMLYSPVTGKRIKEPFNHITWVHKALKQPDFELRQCLFGGHLLNDETKPVAIVESEKTAVIASVYLPQFIWLAVGSLTNLSTKMCDVLKGRKIVLFPDLKCFEKWNEKAIDLSKQMPGSTFIVSDFLEKNSTADERENGNDIADYLIKPKPIQKAIETMPLSNFGYRSKLIIAADGLLYTNMDYETEISYADAN